MVALGRDILALKAPGEIEDARQWLLQRTEDGRGSSALPTLLSKIYLGTNRVSEAARWVTYARVVTFVDAASCADPTAPREKLQGLSTNFGQQDEAISRMSIPDRVMLVDAALALEARTWPVRRQQPSRWLCSGGIEALRAKLARGEPGTVQAVGENGSRYGKQITYKVDPAFRPQLRSAAEWSLGREQRLPAARRAFLLRAGVDPQQAAER